MSAVWQNLSQCQNCEHIHGAQALGQHSLCSPSLLQHVHLLRASGSTFFQWELQKVRTYCVSSLVCQCRRSNLVILIQYIKIRFRVLGYFHLRKVEQCRGITSAYSLQHCSLNYNRSYGIDIKFQRKDPLDIFGKLYILFLQIEFEALMFCHFSRTVSAISLPYSPLPCL